MLTASRVAWHLAIDAKPGGQAATAVAVQLTGPRRPGGGQQEVTWPILPWCVDIPQGQTARGATGDEHLRWPRAGTQSARCRAGAHQQVGHTGEGGVGVY
jgi:hypothetical protein